MDMLKIVNAIPSSIPAGMVLVSFNRKSTKNSPVDDADKFRCAVVPAFDWSCQFQPTEAQYTFKAALEETIMETAGEILKSHWIDGKPETIPAEKLTLAAIIGDMQRQQTSQRLNGDTIKAWYDGSQTAKDAASRYGKDENGKKKQAALREKFLSLASNNPAIMPDLATKMLSYVAEQDASNTVCAAVVKRLARLTQVNVSSDDL
jgi:hypothetical protein